MVRPYLLDLGECMIAALAGAPGVPRRRPAPAMRTRRAIPKAHWSFGLEAVTPLAGGPQTDPCGWCGGLRGQSAAHHVHQAPWIVPRPSGILVDVHSVSAKRFDAW